MSDGWPLPDAEATDRAGASLAPLLGVGDVVTLRGPLGAGKTSLVRGLLCGLGHAGEVASPSFAIALPYAPPEVRLPVTHVDLYRLDHADEMEELGLDDALLDGALVVEWADRVTSRLWRDALALSLEPVAGGGRRLTWVAGPAWKGRWPPPLP